MNKLDLIFPSRVLVRENQELEKEYLLTKLYCNLVKEAYEYMSAGQQQEWLKLNSPQHIDAEVLKLLTPPERK